jgi:hypothetical protein
MIIQQYEIESALERRIEKHGNKEFYEAIKCIHENQEKQVTAKEFRDLAVAAFWAYLSLEVKK